MFQSENNVIKKIVGCTGVIKCCRDRRNKKDKAAVFRQIPAVPPQEVESRPRIAESERPIIKNKTPLARTMSTETCFTELNNIYSIPEGEGERMELVPLH